MTRTTLDLDPTVLEQLRERAATEHKSMGQVASERLAIGLEQDVDAPSELPPLNWVRKDMGPWKVDIEDKEALWRVLDEEWYEPRERS